MVQKFVMANNVKQSMYSDNMDCHAALAVTKSRCMDCHGLRPRSDGVQLAM